MFCPHCGSKISETAKFCKYCGTKIEDAKPAKDGRTAVGKTSGKPAEAGNAGWTKKKYILIAVIVLVIGCGIAGGIRYLSEFGIFHEPESKAESVKKATVGYGFEVENKNIELGDMKVFYPDGDKETVSDYEVYIDNKYCRGKDGRIRVSGLEGRHKLLLQWEKGGKVFEHRKNIWLEPEEVSDEFTEATEGNLKLFRFGLLPAKTEEGKWGYIDDSGNYKIPAKFDTAAEFSEGLACVSQNGKYGYIDTLGNYVIEPQFTDARGFYHGMAAATKGSGAEPKYGYIDTRGKFLLKQKYKYAGSFRGKLAPVSKTGKKIKYINRAGKVILSQLDDGTEFYEDGAAIVIDGGKYGCIDETGSYIIAPETDGIDKYGDKLGYSEGLDHDEQEYEEYERSLFQQNLVPVQDGEQVGYMDTEGEWQIDPQFEDAEPFSEDRAAVKTEERGEYGYINEDGDIVIAPQFVEAARFRNSAAKVDNGDGYGYIDKDGEYLIDPDLGYICQSDMYKDRFFASWDDSGDTVMDVNEEVYGDSGSWKFNSGIFRGGYALVMREFEDGSYLMGIVDLEGKMAVPVEFDMLWGYRE